MWVSPAKLRTRLGCATWCVQGRGFSLCDIVWSGPVVLSRGRCQQLLLFTARKSLFWVGAAMCAEVFALTEVGLDFSYANICSLVVVKNFSFRVSGREVAAVLQSGSMSTSSKRERKKRERKKRERKERAQRESAKRERKERAQRESAKRERKERAQRESAKRERKERAKKRARERCACPLIISLKFCQRRYSIGFTVLTTCRGGALIHVE